jgi:glucosamine--fructose-6-phosphate aminotransferase (isomerizing)
VWHLCCSVSAPKKTKTSAAAVVLDGLKRLEYRGYDSWGVAVLEHGKIKLDKHAGAIGVVNNTLPLPVTAVALGHTRWATHGGVTDLNAHPHLASDGSFGLVQNGVVENYQELKTELLAQGFSFISQTDTEVIVHLIEARKKKGVPPELSEVIAVFKRCKGRNTIALLTRQGSILALRHGSPLILGRNSAGDAFLSSDVLSLAPVASEYYAVENHQAVEIDPVGKVGVWSVESGRKIQFGWSAIVLEQLQINKEKYDFFTRKEIYEQAQILGKPLEQSVEQWQVLQKKLRSARRIYLVGSGSASFVAEHIAFTLRNVGLPAQSLKAYESRSYQKLFGPADLAIAVSQSGETADTIEALEWMKKAGVTIGSIVNMPGSTITTLSDLPFMLQIGPEVGIASTKAVTAAMVWGLGVAEWFKTSSVKNVQKIVKKYQASLTDWLAETENSPAFTHILELLLPAQTLLVLGKGQLYAAAQEFSLKMKEISYIHAESFSGGELKHGMLALVEQGTPVVCLVANDDEQADMLNAAAQVKARGATVIGISAENNAAFDHWLPVPSAALLAAVAAVIPSQLLTYHLALQKGFNPDKPRNLAKSVTVK